MWLGKSQCTRWSELLYVSLEKRPYFGHTSAWVNLVGGREEGVGRWMDGWMDVGRDRRRKEEKKEGRDVKASSMYNSSSRCTMRRVQERYLEEEVSGDGSWEKVKEQEEKV